MPTPPEASVLVYEPAREALAAGVCIYPTRGPYVLFEHFATNPEAPLKSRYAALWICLESARLYCATASKVGIMVVRNRTLYRICKKAGYVPHMQAAVLHVDPLYSFGAPVDKVESAVKVPKKGKRRGRRP